MANTIKIKRGLKANLPTLSEGEFAYATDTNELYIGTASGNVLVNPDYTSLSDTVFTETSSSITTRTVTIDGVTSWDDVKNIPLHIKAATYGTASASTLNINSLGAKSIYFPSLSSYGLTTTPSGCYWVRTNGVYIVVWDGTYLKILNPQIRNADTNYKGVVQLSSSTSSTSTAYAATPSAVKSAYDLASTAKETADAAQTALDDKLDVNFVVNGFAGIDEATATLADCKRSATIVVGASDSKYYNSNVPAVDYICAGTSDQTTINNAISALPSGGGKIVLLEGTYNISEGITVSKSNVTIEGMGIGSTTLTKSTGGIFALDGNYCKICNLTLEGNEKSNYAGGIYVKGTHTTIRDVEVSGFMYGVNNTYENQNGYSVFDAVYAHDNLYGIHINVQMTTVSNCKCIGNTRGLNIEGGFNNVHDNYCVDNDYGVYLNNYSKVKYNKVSDNYIIRGTGQTSDYTSSQYTIYVASSATYNEFSDNYIPGKNYTNNGGSTNTFTNNKYS